MKLWVGLGNPGVKYAKTRHNAGALALEFLSTSFRHWKLERKLQGLTKVCEFYDQEVLLLFPQTYMNLSGNSIAATLKYYNITPSEMLVFHDETEIALGKIQFKKGGGHRGHNGLRHIITVLGHGEFNRIRIGLGRPEYGNLADWLLSFWPIPEIPFGENSEKFKKSNFIDFIKSNNLLS